MPELPDLEILREVLENRVLGRKIIGASAVRAKIVKSKDLSLDLLTNKSFSAVSRRGKYLIFSLEDKLSLVIHLMLAGRFVLCRSDTRLTKATGLRIAFLDGEDLRLIENGNIKLVEVYVVYDPNDVGGIAAAGIEPLSGAFNLAMLKELVHGRRCHVKKFLTDQRVIAGIGSAYADEIMFESRLSPVRYMNTLTDVELVRLQKAIVTVLSEAIEQIRKETGDSLFTDDIRDFLKVYKRTGQPCPVCGAKISEIRYANTRTYYCPVCQSGIAQHNA
jgi:formamidopyrimidine-DNA glycosylase